MLLYGTFHLGVLWLLCSIGAAATSSATTPSVTPTPVGKSGSSSAPISIIRNPVTVSSSSGTLSTGSLSSSSGQVSSQSSLVSSSVSNVDNPTTSGSLSFSSSGSLSTGSASQASTGSVSTGSGSLLATSSLSSTRSPSPTRLTSPSGSQSTTGSGSAFVSQSTSSASSSFSSFSSSSQSSTSTGPIQITVTTSGTTQVVTVQPSSITSPPTLTINWSTVTPSSTTGVSTATHDSHGWPIIAGFDCWFCPSIGDSGGIGWLFPDITGPGIMPPPGPGEAPPGFSADTPAITLDSAGDPSYDSTEPTDQPTNTASTTNPTSSSASSTITSVTSTSSSISSTSSSVSFTKSSSSTSCTSTTTGYDYYITCSIATGTVSLISSASCGTSTVTTTGCAVTTSASTTVVSACPLSIMSSISSAYNSALAAAGTVISGSTIPYALYGYPDDTSSTQTSTPSSSVGSSATSSSSSGVSTAGMTSVSTSRASPSASSTIVSSTGTPTGLSTGTTMITTTKSSTSATSTTGPICSQENNSLMSENYIPASWCFCGDKGPFATISAATTSYCAFSTLPTETISLTTIRSSTPVPTSCFITTGTYSLVGATASSTDTYCQCGQWQAGIGTTTSGSVVLAGCEITTPWPIISTISTIPPSTTTVSTTSTTSTALAYHTGTCDIHIYEASDSDAQPLYVQLNITDGAGDLLTSQNYKLDWGKNATVTASESQLPYDIDIEFLESKTTRRKMGKRELDPVPAINTADWEAWILAITAGDTSWTDKDTDSSSLPYCSVGGWDNGNFWTWFNSLFGVDALPNRQLDCHWSC